MLLADLVAMDRKLLRLLITRITCDFILFFFFWLAISHPTVL